MKLWSRFVVGSLVLALVLSVGVGPAAAASKKKKKEEASSEEHHVTHHSSKAYLSGTNVWGRPGLLYGDTAETVGKNEAEAALHVLWQGLPGFSFGAYSFGGNAFTFPLGADLGVDRDFDLYGMAAFNLVTYSSSGPGVSSSTSASNFIFQAGGKYRIAAEDSHTPDFGVGADLTFPTSTTVAQTTSVAGVGTSTVSGYYGGGGNVIVTPKGMISYTLTNGMLLNGELGIAISSATYVQVDGGVGYPLSDKWTGIAEIGANQIANGFSFLGLGVRGDFNGTKGQAVLGIPLNGGGIQLGVGIIL